MIFSFSFIDDLHWLIERLDHDTTGIHTTLCDHAFDCPCVSKWTYLSCQVGSFVLSFFSFLFFLIWFIDVYYKHKRFR